RIRPAWTSRAGGSRLHRGRANRRARARAGQRPGGSPRLRAHRRSPQPAHRCRRDRLSRKVSRGPMLNAIRPNIIASLGLFFSGLRLIGSNLRQAAGRRLRTIIGRLTQQRWVASLVGLLAGAFIQSSSGIVFILVSLVSSGLTTVKRALPIVTWANVGCSALVFVAVLDLRLAILYLIGVAGAGFAFERSHKNDLLSAGFGVGLLFYGMELMKVGVEPLKAVEWFPQMLNGTGQSYMVAFAGGAAFSFITQSSTAVSIVAIGFAQTGLIQPYPA